MSEVNPYESPLNTSHPRASDESDHEVRVAKFGPATTWGVITIAALVASVLVAVAGLVYSAQLIAVYQAAGSLGEFDVDRENACLDRLNKTFAAILVLRCLTVPPLLTWMYQAHRNLPALGNARLDSKPIWVLVCWFVPILNLYFPYQVMSEIWWRSDPRRLSADNAKQSDTLVRGWWAAWIVAAVTGVWGNYLDEFSAMQPEVTLATWVDIAFLASFALSGLLLIWIIVALNRRQSQRFALLQQEPAAVAT